MTSAVDQNPGLLIRLTKVLAEQGGRLVVSYDKDKAEWMIGMEWGQEAPDSDMAGAASYGLGPELATALAQVVRESRA